MGFTDTSCGGRVSGSLNTRDATLLFPVKSVARIVAVRFVPVVGAEAIEKAKAFVVRPKREEVTVTL